jgi:hypothetical protein
MKFLRSPIGTGHSNWLNCSPPLKYRISAWRTLAKPPPDRLCRHAVLTTGGNATGRPFI